MQVAQVFAVYRAQDPVPAAVAPRHRFGQHHFVHAQFAAESQVRVQVAAVREQTAPGHGLRRRINPRRNKMPDRHHGLVEGALHPAAGVMLRGPVVIPG